MSKSNKHDTLITAVLNNMSLQDKVNIANLTEDNIQLLEAVMSKYLKGKNKQLSEDDTEEAVKVRLETYHKETEPILDKYPTIKLNGEQQIAKVTQDFLDEIKSA